MPAACVSHRFREAHIVNFAGLFREVLAGRYCRPCCTQAVSRPRAHQTRRPALSARLSRSSSEIVLRTSAGEKTSRRVPASCREGRVCARSLWCAWHEVTLQPRLHSVKTYYISVLHSAPDVNMPVCDSQTTQTWIVTPGDAGDTSAAARVTFAFTAMYCTGYNLSLCIRAQRSRSPKATQLR